MNQTAKTLLNKIQNRSALVGIIGLGYVGLPLALCFTEKNFKVLGFDVDPEKVEKLNRGECYIKHLDPSRLQTAIGWIDCDEQLKTKNSKPKTNATDGCDTSAVECDENVMECDGKLKTKNSKLKTNVTPLFQATSDFTRLAECDAILICVPTPLGPHKEPDLSYVENSTREIRKTLRKGQLIILESTTYPGTTDELLREILETANPEDCDGKYDVAKATSCDAPAMECDELKTKNSKLKTNASDGCDGKLKTKNSKLKTNEPPRLGETYFLAFSPEREDPGNPKYGTKTIPKVVGGVDEISGNLAQALYAEVLDSTVRVKNARTAEATKLMENIFRAVNIALVNELKMVFEKMDVDIWDVLDAAETKPFGFMRFNPGPGLGGHCIPLDPFYLAWKAREVGQPTRFIELAGEINTHMPQYVVDKLAHALNEHGKAVKGAKILVLGLAYKPNIDDPRESPAFEIIHLLLERGAEVSYHDPHIPVAPRMRSWPNLPRMMSQALTPELLEATDAVVLVTDHRSVDYDLVVERSPVVIDTRGVYRNQDGTITNA